MQGVHMILNPGLSW